MAEGNIISRIIGGFFGFFFKNLKRTLATIGILLIVFAGISASVKEKSFQPFIDQIGNSVLRADHTLYVEAKDIEARGSFIVERESSIGKIKSYWQMLITYSRIIAPLYFIILLYILILGIMTRSQGIGGAGTAFWALVILTAFMLVAEGFTAERIAGEPVIPFKGIYHIVKVSPLLLDPVIMNPLVQNNLPGSQFNNQTTQASSYNQSCGTDLCL